MSSVKTNWCSKTKMDMYLLYDIILISQVLLISCNVSLSEETIWALSLKEYPLEREYKQTVPQGKLKWRHFKGTYFRSCTQEGFKSYDLSSKLKINSHRHAGRLNNTAVFQITQKKKKHLQILTHDMTPAILRQNYVLFVITVQCSWHICDQNQSWTCTSATWVLIKYLIKFMGGRKFQRTQAEHWNGQNMYVVIIHTCMHPDMGDIWVYMIFKRTLTKL